MRVTEVRDATRVHDGVRSRGGGRGGVAGAREGREGGR